MVCWAAVYAPVITMHATDIGRRFLIAQTAQLTTTVLNVRYVAPSILSTTSRARDTEPATVALVALGHAFATSALRRLHAQLARRDTSAPNAQRVLAQMMNHAVVTEVAMTELQAMGLAAVQLATRESRARRRAQSRLIARAVGALAARTVRVHARFLSPLMLHRGAVPLVWRGIGGRVAMTRAIAFMAPALPAMEPAHAAVVTGGLRALTCVLEALRRRARNMVHAM